jgi:hypothetical protein
LHVAKAHGTLQQRMARCNGNTEHPGKTGAAARVTVEHDRTSCNVAQPDATQYKPLQQSKT